LGTISAFAYRHRETKETQGNHFMIGRSAAQTSEILNLASGEKTMKRTQTFD